MIFGLLFQIVFIGLIILGIRRLRAGTSGGGFRGASVRRFFQYLLLYGLIIIVAVGFSGLLARLFETSDVLVTDQTALARNVAFVLVGTPLFIGIALWTRRQYQADRHEAESFSWTLYFTLATLTLLVGASLGVRQVLSWASGQSDYQSQQLAKFVVWGCLWAAHWWINRRFTPVFGSRAHNLIGSLYGLIFLYVGLVQLLSGALERAFNLGGDSLFLPHRNAIVEGAITFLVGALIWWLYWLRSAYKSARDVMWLAFVMLIGVGGGLVTAVVSLSISLYNSLVWLFGTPGSAEASIHFRNIPTAFAAAIVGGFVWMYHRTVLHYDSKDLRTEVRRVYEYLISAIGLVASAVGLAIVLVSLIDAFTESNRLAGAGSRNTLLAAVTLLAVGGPIWWTFWSRIQKQVLQDPKGEYASPSRRVYLFVLFGIGGLTAVVTLLVGVFLMLDDLFKGNFGEESLRRIRIPIGLILSTVGVAGYHWLVYKSEREQYEELTPHRRIVLLVGPHDAQMIRDLSDKCNAKVQAWARTDATSTEWRFDELVQAISASEHPSVLVLQKGDGIEVIPLQK
jgi:hypothetical protein